MLPLHPAPRHKDAFPDAILEEPVSWSLDYSEKPQWMRRAKIYGPHYSNWTNSEGKPVPELLEKEPWISNPKPWLDMLRCTLAVDEGLGKITDLLKKQKRYDNTIFIFMADNGWFFGEHRRGDKRLAYEESIKIPFIISYPAMIKPGSIVEGMAANIDIGPSLLEMAGIQTPASMQGESFVPLFKNKIKDRKSPFFYEYFQEKYAPGIPTILSVRTPEWKYIHFPFESVKEGNFDELYNLKIDPHELHNLVHSPESKTQLNYMKKLLEKAKKQYAYTDPPYCYKISE
ncbi:MAG TPA: hypothetical protein DC049_15065 [Spirochaetia bacterium]|nr:hypothetical protein [Spirochaetia bacterium]